MTVLSLVSDTEKIANFCGAGQEIKRFYSHKFTIDKDIMRAIISTKIKTKSFIMAEQPPKVQVVLTIRHIDYTSSGMIAEVTESAINEYLSNVGRSSTFYSKCFSDVKFYMRNTRKLEIECFLAGKRRQFCLNKITSGKCECSDPFVTEHILPLLGKKNEK